MFSLSKVFAFIQELKELKQVSSDYFNASFLFLYTIAPSTFIGLSGGLAFHSIAIVFQIASHQILWKQMFALISLGIGGSLGLLNGLLLAIINPIYFWLLRNASHNRNLIALISGFFGLLVGIISFRMLLPISSFNLGLYLLFDGLEGVILGLAIAGITQMITSWYKDIWESLQQEGNTLSAVEQPDDSKIQLRKTGDSLEILLPVTGISCGTLGMPFVIIAMVIQTFLIREKYGINWGDRDDNFASAIFGLLLFILLCLYCIFLEQKRVRLNISAEKISLSNELWGRSLNPLGSWERQDISELKIQTHTSYLQGSRRLIIEAGKQKYDLNKMTTLSQAEVDWLAYQLRDWLTESGWEIQFNIDYLAL